MHLRTFLSLSLCPGVPLSWGPSGLLANAQRGARSSRQPGGMGGVGSGVHHPGIPLRLPHSTVTHLHSHPQHGQGISPASAHSPRALADQLSHERGLRPPALGWVPAKV